MGVGMNNIVRFLCQRVDGQEPDWRDMVFVFCALVSIMFWLGAIISITPVLYNVFIVYMISEISKEEVSGILWISNNTHSLANLASSCLVIAMTILIFSLLFRRPIKSRE